MTTIDSEKLVERTLFAEVKLKKGLCIKLIPDFFNGLPDRLVLLPGKKILFVELKTTKRKAEKLQAIIHNRIRNLGFDVYVIDTVEDVHNLIKKVCSD